MSSLHTPGPWHVGYSTKACAVYMKPLSEGWLVRDQIARFDRDTEGEANARLIAAAPDLLAIVAELAALKHDDGGRSFPSEELIAKARAALAKAAGA